jgi:hypothetical protein
MKKSEAYYIPALPKLPDILVPHGIFKDFDFRNIMFQETQGR